MNTDKLKGEILYLDADLGISFQDVNGMGMCHCEINTPTRAVLKRCRMQIDRLQWEHKRDAFGVAERGDTKHHKFLTMMGFKRFKNQWILDENGNDKIVQIWWREFNVIYRDRIARSN